MAKKLLKRTEQHYADSYEEAAEIVAEAKQQEELTMQKINEKHNSKGFYFLVDTQFTYSTPKEEMDKRPESDAPDGQLSIEDVHEGVEVTLENDGSVSVKTDEQAPF